MEEQQQVKPSAATSDLIYATTATTYVDSPRKVNGFFILFECYLE